MANRFGLRPRDRDRTSLAWMGPKQTVCNLTTIEAIHRFSPKTRWNRLSRTKHDDYAAYHDNYILIDNYISSGNVILLMSTEYTNLQSQRAADRRTHDGPVGGMLRSLVVVAGALTIAALTIPVLVLGSALAMIVLLWPMFLGAYLDFGYVPGRTQRGVMVTAGEWWLLSAIWIGLLIVVGFAILAFRRGWSIRAFHRSGTVHSRFRRLRPRV